MRNLTLMTSLLLFLSPAFAMATVHNGTINGDEAQATTCAAGSVSQIVGTVTYDDVSGLFSWSYTYGDNGPAFNNGTLFGAGTESVSHFHGPAVPGVNAGVQVGTTTGTPNSGSLPITAPQGADLLAELWYLNVHSTTCGGGELRGQVLISSPVATPSGSMPMVLALVMAMFGTALFLLRRSGAHSA